MTSYVREKLKQRALNEGRKQYPDIYEFNKDVVAMHVKVASMINNFFDSSNGLEKEDLMKLDKACRDLESQFSKLRQTISNVDNN